MKEAMLMATMALILSVIALVVTFTHIFLEH